MREVARSEPTYKRRLFYASLFFTALFVADIVLIARLAIDHLGHQVVDEAFRASLAALETRLPPSTAVPDDPYPAAEPCLSDPSQSALESSGPCISAPRPPPATPRVFRGMTYRWQRVVTDTQGRVLWRGFGQGHRIEPAAPDGDGPRHADVPERWQIGDEPRDVVALHQAGGAGDDFHEVGIPRELLDQELARLRRDLDMKLWAGAIAAVLLLLLAFLYVMRLLHRTRTLEAQAQMDDRLAYVGALAAGLAHEIRNPLNVLSMNLQMLEEDLARGDGDPRVFLAALQGEIRRLSNLVNNFLTYARPNQPRFETRDLNEVLRDVCQFVRPEFETRSIRLDTGLAPYLPPVDLDEGQIRQAVLNILMNATQVLKPGGSVKVESRVGPQGEVIVAIEDDGPGIRPEDQQKIFEVFYSTRGGGTGLGLPIAARIMEAHGGTIAVERPPSGGARFVLTLPRRHPSGTPSDAASAVAAYGTR